MSESPRSFSVLVSVASVLGIFFGWQFCLLPPIGQKILAAPFIVDPDGPVLQIITVTAHAAMGVLLAIMAARAPRWTVRATDIRISAAFELVMLAVLVFAPACTAKTVVVAVLCAASIATGWVPLMMLLAHVDVAVTEKAFAVSLPISACSMALPQIAGPFVSLGILAVLAVALPIVYSFAARWSSFSVESACSEAVALSFIDSCRSDRAGTRTLGKCFVVYVCVAVCKPVIALPSTESGNLAWAFYAFGFIIAAALFWLFVTRSRRVDLASSVRYVFPCVALGVVLGSIDGAVACAAAIAVLSACHGAFEVMARTLLAAYMREKPEIALRRCTLGLALIGCGSLFGVVALTAIALLEPTSQAAMMLALVVCGLATFFVRSDVNPNAAAAFASSANDDHALSQPSAPVKASALADETALISVQYELTGRETEVLGYLLQGRSHPFIRDELGISKGTVDTHVRHIYQKCGVSTKQELISLAQSLTHERSACV